MDKARALFRALLPPDDTLYTAAEIVRRYFPGVSKKKDPELFAIYEAHHKVLNRLMRDSNYYAKPDNQDPITGFRPRGKGMTARHPRPWNRATWLLLLSDDVDEWLMTLRQKLISQTAALQQGTQFFCNLATFEKSYEEPPAEQIPEEEPTPVIEPDEEPAPEPPSGQAEEEPAPTGQPDEELDEVADKEPEPEKRRPAISARSWKSAAVALAVAAILMAAILWPRPPIVPVDVIEEATKPHHTELSVSDYLRRKKTPSKLVYIELLPDDMVAGTWDATAQPVLLASVRPPPVLIGR